MLFDRREKPSFLAKLRGFLLPQAGWRRSAKYIGHRVARLPGTPASIAMGFACGAAASFTPLVGFHFLLAAFLAWVLRGNLIASAIGTVVGNPWTFPFIWVATFEVGSRLLGAGLEGTSVDFRHFFRALWDSLAHLDMAVFVHQVLPVWIPMLVGSIPLGLLAWAICYWPIKRAVHGYQHARVARRHRKALKAEAQRRRHVEEMAEEWAKAERGDGSAGGPPPGAAMMMAGSLDEPARPAVPGERSHDVAADPPGTR